MKALFFHNRAAFTALALSQAHAQDPAQPFDGKSLTGWTAKGEADHNFWKTGEPALDPAQERSLTITGNEGALVNLVPADQKGVDLFTDETFGSVRIELEFMVPKGANSGVYVMGEYEVQVLDSHGVEKPGDGDLGAIYGGHAPRVNAAKAPGEWQKYVIEFQAPKFDEKGAKTENARFLKVTLNDQTLHENVEMPGVTPGGLTGQESAKGPLMFQGDHGIVAYRNIKITPLP